MMERNPMPPLVLLSLPVDLAAARRVAGASRTDVVDPDAFTRLDRAAVATELGPYGYEVVEVMPPRLRAEPGGWWLDAVCREEPLWTALPLPEGAEVTPADYFDGDTPPADTPPGDTVTAWGDLPATTAALLTALHQHQRAHDEGVARAETLTTELAETRQEVTATLAVIRDLTAGLDRVDAGVYAAAARSGRLTFTLDGVSVTPAPDPCPACQGTTRDTTGMVCTTCGRDYGP